MEEPVDFERLVAECGPRLHRGLVAAYGPEVGAEASADALAWGWEHQARLTSMRNPVGYLFRVGQSKARRYRRKAVPEVREVPNATEPTSDPDLVAALAQLTLHQRTAVVLVHGHSYHLDEAASVLGCSVSSVRNHIRRGLEHLHRELEDTHAIDR